jgi:serine/threonine-protein kinase
MLTNPLDHDAVAAAFPEFSVDVDPLGCGGMKNAYKMEREGDVAVLKVVREPMPPADEEGAVSLPERIRREMDGMRAINHRGIVQVIDGPDAREIDGRDRVWYVEPFYAGGTLTDRIGSPWSHDDVLNLVSALTDAAEELANHRVVHRDIKPGNIVFDDSDNPVLLDLGIAYFQDLTPLTEGWGHSPRTPSYAAPEQFELRRRTSIDFRTDLFLIGIVAFEALTGRHPFNPSEAEGYLDRLSTGDLDSDAFDAVDALPCIRNILQRLLAPGMSQRFRKFEFLRDDIEACR